MESREVATYAFAENLSEIVDFAAYSEPEEINTTEKELMPEVFKACRKLMSPVMSFLKQLDIKTEFEEDKVVYLQNVFIVGLRISEFIYKYRHLKFEDEWRCVFWIYVSYFSHLSPKKLYKMYRHVVLYFEKYGELSFPSYNLERKDLLDLVTCNYEYEEEFFGTSPSEEDLKDTDECVYLGYVFMNKFYPNRDNEPVSSLQEGPSS